MRGIFPVMAPFVAASALVACYPVAKVVPEPTGDASSAPAASSSSAPATSNEEAPSLPRSRPFTDDGLRMPDMLGLPEDREFRASGTSRSAEPDAVISRPPTDPPARPKNPPTE